MADNAKEVNVKMGEIYSQCWESEEFKADFMADPKKYLKEYGIPYDESKDYKVIDTPEKTIIYVLPYEGVKPALEAMANGLTSNVKDLENTDAKQIIPEGWSMQIVQSTEDTVYLAIPVCPDNLTPEELELINGGCGFLGVVFVAFGVVVFGWGVFMVAQVASAVDVAIVAETAIGIHFAVSYSEVSL